MVTTADITGGAKAHVLAMMIFELVTKYVAFTLLNVVFLVFCFWVSTGRQKGLGGEFSEIIVVFQFERVRLERDRTGPGFEFIIRHNITQNHRDGISNGICNGIFVRSGARVLLELALMREFPA